tara:strand:- start:102 stop:674 length:573 start_codon:yes stop_codon:yes gene_type:complete
MSEGNIKKAIIIGDELLVDFDYDKIKDEDIISTVFDHDKNLYPHYLVSVDPNDEDYELDEVKKLIDEEKCQGFFLSKKILTNYPELKEKDNIIYIEDFIAQRCNPFQYLLSYSSQSVCIMFAMLLGFNKVDVLGMNNFNDYEHKNWEHLVFTLTGYTYLNKFQMNVYVWNNEELAMGADKYFTKKDISLF